DEKRRGHLTFNAVNPGWWPAVRTIYSAFSESYSKFNNTKFLKKFSCGVIDLQDPTVSRFNSRLRGMQDRRCIEPNVACLSEAHDFHTVARRVAPRLRE